MKEESIFKETLKGKKYIKYFLKTEMFTEKANFKNKISPWQILTSKCCKKTLNTKSEQRSKEGQVQKEV